jgi:putative copper resistance protein D
MLGTAPDPTSVYGRVLLAKVALFGFMLMLAAANRYWLMPRLAQQDRLLSVLVRTIAMEQALAAAVLLAVSALGLVNPSM